MFDFHAMLDANSILLLISDYAAILYAQLSALTRRHFRHILAPEYLPILLAMLPLLLSHSHAAARYDIDILRPNISLLLHTFARRAFDYQPPWASIYHQMPTMIEQLT